MEHLAAVTEQFVRVGVGSFVESGHELVRRYRALTASYAVGIVFPDESASWYRFDLANDPVRLERGGEADVVHRIAASALVGWVERKKSFFYVRGYSRCSSVLYRLSRAGQRVRVEEQPLPDLLMFYLLHVAPGSELAAKKRIDWELHQPSG